MPKTNDKDAYYFPHDCNARNDPKVLALRSVYGAEGYGVYFMLIEILREQPDYKLPVTKYIWSSLAMQMHTDASVVQEIVDACCTEFTDGDDPLLVNDGQYLFSASLLRRMEHADDVSLVRSAAARKRWGNQPCKDSCPDGEDSKDANLMQKHSKSKSLHDAKMKTPPSPYSPSTPLSSPLPLSPEPPITLPPIIPPLTPLTPFPRVNAQARQNAAAKSDPFADFAGADRDLRSTLRDFLEMRVKIKKPMTDRAKKLLLTELEKLSSNRDEQIAILNQSIASSWAGVFALKEQSGRHGGKNENANVFLDMLREEQRNGQG